ncbi:MAG: hypothetical protein MUF10_10650 [Thermoanaerobaculaceae bacterium]|jgi:hypothetical protein|nr:hypothetical protein [Thermoanaerobaculaceae bacterium]
MAHRYTMQVVSDVVRNGLGVELLSEDGQVVAEVFRCDGDHTVVVSTFSFDVPLGALEELLEKAKSRLEPFEDGFPLSSAEVVAPRQIGGKEPGDRS